MATTTKSKSKLVVPTAYRPHIEALRCALAGRHIVTVGLAGTGATRVVREFIAKCRVAARELVMVSDSSVVDADRSGFVDTEARIVASEQLAAQHVATLARVYPNAQRVVRCCDFPYDAAVDAEIHRMQRVIPADARFFDALRAVSTGDLAVVASDDVSMADGTVAPPTDEKRRGPDEKVDGDGGSSISSSSGGGGGGADRDERSGGERVDEGCGSVSSSISSGDSRDGKHREDGGES